VISAASENILAITQGEDESYQMKEAVANMQLQNTII
jgi:hypothetical protein